ncbi:MAG TPA: hypothetical protein VFM70_11510 [Salinimicrobium sp.]|nr:hypothetical protein [Salinimicrobium sp.]
MEKRQQVFPLESIKSVGVIVNMDVFSQAEAFLKLQKELDVENLKIVAFSDSKKPNQEAQFLQVSPKNIGIGGSIKSAEIKNFLEQEFDLLLGYNNKGNLSFNLLIATSKANFKVGIDVENEQFYDLIIKTDIQDVEGFSKELIKYLRILKMLKNE